MVRILAKRSKVIRNQLGLHLIISRWGRIGRHENSPHSNVLQAATVPVISDWDCFQMTGLLNYEDQVCAGGVGAEASACPGDSGGALQVAKDSRRTRNLHILTVNLLF